jgi:propionyl-CoA synthetase
MARADDVINTAGHRISTGAIEQILLDHPDVADCAVIGVNDTLRGQDPVSFVVLNKGSEDEVWKDSAWYYPSHSEWGALDCSAHNRRPKNI